jgi:hypothetical protein
MHRLAALVMKVRRLLWLDAPLKPRSRYSVRNQIASAFGQMPISRSLKTDLQERLV